MVGYDFNDYFSDDFASLREFYVPPHSVFERVKIDDFIGREWLTAKLDAFLNDPQRKSGVFQLIGEAGVGKTSFMAHLVQERHYPHLFAEQLPGEANVSRALQSLGAQLIACYRIDPYKDADTLVALSAFPDFLERVLRLATNTLAQGEQIVIVCDALDEAGVAPNGNVFGLPKALPDRVYLLLAQRPVPLRLDFDLQPYIERLEAMDADNQHDMEVYLHMAAQRAEIRKQLVEKGYTSAQFVRTLAAKSAGVWMYLHYVIDEIQKGTRGPLDLENVPQGLSGYYAEYWNSWREGRRGDGRWTDLYLPLLATLAAIQQPVDVDRLIDWSDVVASPNEVEHLLSKEWRAFIAERIVEGQTVYRLYHASLRDFITGRAEAHSSIEELVQRTRASHAHIVETYRRRCDGDWTRLIEDDYARHYLTTHLAGASRHTELFAMVVQSDAWAKARYQKEENYGGFLADLELAWRWVESEEAWSIGRQIRCALIKGSIHALAGNISPDLLRLLVETQIWSPVRALSHIPHLSNEHTQAQALSSIIDLLPGELKNEALGVSSQ